MAEGTERLFAEERQNRILALLNENGKVLIPELCTHFSVSSVTVRNDLNELERQGRLRRTHGGAIPVSKTALEPDFRQKQVHRPQQKEALAAYAATLVEDGDTLVLDTGTTMLALAQKLTGKHRLTVVTNDLKIAALLDDQSDHTVILTGGTLRRGFYCTTGPAVIDQLRRHRADTCFLSTNGFSLRAGFTTPDEMHAEMKREMARISAQTVMLCDSEKFGRDLFSVIMPLSEADRILTDNGLDRSDREALLRAGLPLTVVDLQGSAEE